LERFNQFENLDCFFALPLLPAACIDLIIFDYPYGITHNPWDTNFAWGKLFDEGWRVLKPNGVIINFSKQPLTSHIILSQEPFYKFEQIWEKEKGTDSYNANKKPLCSHENISIFCRGKLPYYPKKSKGLPYQKVRNAEEQSANYGKDSQPCTLTKNKGNRYPKTVLHYARDHANQGIHPTQKPVALLAYLIKSFSKPNAVVLDPTVGSGATIIACKKTDRDYIAYELDVTYFSKAQARIAYFDRYGKDEYKLPAETSVNNTAITDWLGVTNHG
jgi:site-specific DNA-methyltransferase (adenine-specific)